MKKYALIALCLLVTFGVVQVVANAHQVEPPDDNSKYLCLPLLVSPQISI
jgi:hypothetical protein